MALNLHCHLEGCVRPSTAAKLAIEAGVPAPAGGWDEALVMRSRGDLTIFLGHVAAGYPLLGTEAALRRVAREAVEDATADGQEFLELRFGPATHRRPGFPIDAVIRAVRDGVRDGVAATGTPAAVVVCLLRGSDPATNLEVARSAANLAGDGVMGLDVAGDELLLPALEPYVEAFQIAAAAGLGVTAHAAEAGPPSSVRAAAELLGVRRIGHGSRAVDDPEILAWSVDHGTTFEVCPTSNVLTGAAASLGEHPIHAFIAAGVGVVLGDDDPVTIDRHLGADVRELLDAGLTSAHLAEIRQRSIEVGFMDEGVRAALGAPALGVARL
jgi:adenosine deaminase